MRNPPLVPELVDQLIDVWVDVSNAGGAVGFVGPVDVDTVRPTAEAAFARVAAGADDLVVAVEDGQPVGFGFLATNDLALHSHFATVKRLQRHPRARGRAIGSAILAELEAAGRDRGMERIVLTVRGGTGREQFYMAHGYVVEGVLPRRLRIADGDIRDEISLGKVLMSVAADESNVDRSGAPRPHDAPGPRHDVAQGTHSGTELLVVQRIDPDLPLPAYAHEGDAGLDLRARVEVTLAPGERAVIPTGVAIALPEGCVGLVHPRSGLAARHGVALVNAPGTIDEGYRGEIQVIVVNLDRTAPVTLSRGDRIAQLVVQRVERVSVVEAEQLPESHRGEGGFGSTGR